METEITSGIRAAIASGDYQEALRLWNRYAAHLREEIDKGVVSETAFAQAGELLEWSRTALLCERAHLQDSLNHSYAARVYAGKPTPRPAVPRP